MQNCPKNASYSWVLRASFLSFRGSNNIWVLEAVRGRGLQSPGILMDPSHFPSRVLAGFLGEPLRAQIPLSTPNFQLGSPLIVPPSGAGEQVCSPVPKLLYFFFLSCLEGRKPCSVSLCLFSFGPSLCEVPFEI